MNSEGLVLVRCACCMLEKQDHWLRIENTYPASFLGNIINTALGKVKQMTEPIYLCKVHFDLLSPIIDPELEIPKN